MTRDAQEGIQLPHLRDIQSTQTKGSSCLQHWKLSSRSPTLLGFLPGGDPISLYKYILLPILVLPHTNDDMKFQRPKAQGDIINSRTQIPPRVNDSITIGVRPVRSLHPARIGDQSSYGGSPPEGTLAPRLARGASQRWRVGAE